MSACIFPGQGSQFVGMAADFAQHPLTADLFYAADDILGFRLRQLMLTGDENELKKTQHAQPALLLAGFAAYTYWQASLADAPPRFLAGHSVGEYTAACVAGCFSIAEALKLVHARGVAMAQAPAGGMVAVLGAEVTAIKEICEKNGVFLANDNAPGQVVLAGTHAQLAQAQDDLDRVAKKVVTLQVSGPFHTPYMQSAADVVAAYLANMDVQAPQVPIVLNFDASIATTALQIKQGLVQQITQTVRWQSVMGVMQAQGVEKLYECGAGKVLTGLARRCDKSLDCQPITGTTL